MKFEEITIFGATGLIGGLLLKLLIDDSDFERIKVISRKPLLLDDKKIINEMIDFSNYKSLSKTVKNSKIVFSAIGTTQSKVNGDNKEYRKIDFDILHNIAMACKENKVENLLFVSSSGANLNSNSFYLKLKGEIEKSILDLNLKSTSVFRPSLLLGKREEKRLGEKIAQIIMPFFSFLMPKNYKPIKADLVAKSMVNVSKSFNPGFKVYHYPEIIKISK
tara:strand:- start:728 stop:1387 length:660 start_codon:yes stop_codon:yes gene_type:complete